MKQPLTIIEADPPFSYTFIHTAGATMRFLVWASGHALLGAGLYSLLTGSDRLLAAIVDGSLLTFLAYATLSIVASSVVIGLIGVILQPLVARLKVLREQRTH